jgi:hypothetical protein
VEEINNAIDIILSYWRILEYDTGCSVKGATEREKTFIALLGNEKNGAETVSL